MHTSSMLNSACRMLRLTSAGLLRHAWLRRAMPPAGREDGMELLQDALADSGPIARPSLHDQIVGRIRDMVIEGTLPSGARIHEGQLGAQLGVSRTPLREALK